jgi:hypothetical protein
VVVGVVAVGATAIGGAVVEGARAAQPCAKEIHAVIAAAPASAAIRRVKRIRFSTGALERHPGHDDKGPT